VTAPHGPRELVPGVHVATSALCATTSTVVARDGAALLVDPAWQPGELARIADWLDDAGLRVSAGVATHAHHDHLLWHPRFGDAPRWASARTAELAVEHRDDLVGQLDPAAPAWTTELLGLVRPLAGPAVPDPFGPGDDEPVEVVVHDGHAPGHTAVAFPERGVLCVGDLLSDVELPLPFDPDDLPAYLAGLDALAPHVARARWLVPGHGTPTDDPVGRLDADRRYLDALLAGEDPDDPRRADPEMEEHHQRLRVLARELVDG
jgi:glyoxylase-like metal-dependent hydrolase (beta-lactamase superfamily II)